MVNKKDDWHHEHRIGEAVKAGIKCFCGGEAYRDILEVTMNGVAYPRVHRIFCPNCGLQMRSPSGNDEDFIVRQWRDIRDLHQHRKEEQERADRAVGMTDIEKVIEGLKELGQHAKWLVLLGTGGRTMDDLISRAAAIEALDHERKVLIEQERYGAEHIVVHHARRIIEELPAVDAVPVVRCRDCKYSVENAKHIDVACEMSYNDPDFYCAAGERKDDDGANT